MRNSGLTTDGQTDRQTDRDTSALVELRFAAKNMYISTYFCRELASFGRNVILCEKERDLLSGASSGNTGHLATNFYYRRPRALLEAEMASRARRYNPHWLAGQPHVPCVKTGLIYLARNSEDEENLAEMLENARLNSVSGVRMISLEEVATREPSLNMDGVTAALISEEEFIVDSWLLAMTHVYGMEVAGVETVTEAAVTRVRMTDEGVWSVATARGEFRARCVINCAGNFGDTVEKLANEVIYLSRCFLLCELLQLSASSLYSDSWKRGVPGVQG